MFNDLKGRRVLVTGSTSGIGLSVAKQLLALGAHVGIHGHQDVAPPDAQAAIDEAGDARCLLSAPT